MRSNFGTEFTAKNVLAHNFHTCWIMMAGNLLCERPASCLINLRCWSPHTHNSSADPAVVLLALQIASDSQRNYTQLVNGAPGATRESIHREHATQNLWKTNALKAHMLAWQEWGSYSRNAPTPGSSVRFNTGQPTYSHMWKYTVSKLE